ncbi:MAG: glutamine-hydrolyzing GMP synthase, partial [Rickettsiales bacterium]|nr:glutamine-hydrolyzing GMP synthase [Rickettsiales bacterium]
MNNIILIIDFGSQVTQLIARRVREFHVFSEIRNPDITLDEIKKIAPKAIILSGGPCSVYEKDAPTIDKGIFDLGIPILGICYGQQLICHLLGGKVGEASDREFGKASIAMIETSPLFYKIQSAYSQVWMSHGDKVEEIPAGFNPIAITANAPFAAISD